MLEVQVGHVHMHIWYFKYRTISIDLSVMGHRGYSQYSHNAWQLTWDIDIYACILILNNAYQPMHNLPGYTLLDVLVPI